MPEAILAVRSGPFFSVPIRHCCRGEPPPAPPPVRQLQEATAASETPLTKLWWCLPTPLAGFRPRAIPVHITSVKKSGEWLTTLRIRTNAIIVRRAKQGSSRISR